VTISGSSGPSESFDLVQSAKSGDAEAFNQLVLLYQPHVFADRN
jgi:hypothetical protein